MASLFASGIELVGVVRQPTTIKFPCRYLRMKPKPAQTLQLIKGASVSVSTSLPTTCTVYIIHLLADESTHLIPNCCNLDIAIMKMTITVLVTVSIFLRRGVSTARVDSSCARLSGLMLGSHELTSIVPCSVQPFVLESLMHRVSRIDARVLGRV